MNPFDYLAERVAAILPDSEKYQNHGAVILSMYTEWNEDIVNASWDMLLKHCTKSRDTRYTAAVKLTFISAAIGKMVCEHVQVPTPEMRTLLAVGDLMLETFLQDDLVEIEREYDGFKAPYLVRILHQRSRVKPTLIGTIFTTPEAITSGVSDVTHKTFIKGRDASESFKKYLDTPFVKATEILRQQPWALNLHVLKAAKANPPPVTIELIDGDGVIVELLLDDITKLTDGMTHLDGTQFLGRNDPRVQRLKSKSFEYNQIIKKADLICDQGFPFYQEISRDYRGRSYYSESFLEYQGSDLARSLFLFYNEEEMTRIGYRFLCIHAACSYNQSYTLEELSQLKWITSDYITYLKEQGLDTISVDKMTLDDRFNWVMANIYTICEWGNGNAVKPEAEKPYAFLAACVEIAGYTQSVHQRLPFTSGLPIPSDGSNNGTQHMAALSKDLRAGELVSLTPSKIQKDFYVSVAQVLKTIIPDFFTRVNMAMKDIRKGISKRACMTRSYSAGKTRIAKNMYEDMHAAGLSHKYSVTEQECTMLAGNMIRAINDVCTGPLKTAKFLQELAEHELDEGENEMSWVTPSGFPVVYQAYLQRQTKQRGMIKGIKGNKDGRVMHVIREDIIGKDSHKRVPCRRSFASGISPNFIHSMDSAHMDNTIVAFGGSFAAVHDSFSVHADRVPRLRQVAKEQFIKQYSMTNGFDYIELALMKHQPTFQYPQPVSGQLDINQVIKSDYFFC